MEELKVFENDSETAIQVAIPEKRESVAVIQNAFNAVNGINTPTSQNEIKEEAMKKIIEEKIIEKQTEQEPLTDKSVLNKEESVIEQTENAVEVLPAQKTQTEIEISKLKGSAEIFGVSQRELENEFIDYKIDKLLKRLDYLIGVPVTDGELRERIFCARRNGFGSVSVLPFYVPMALKYVEGKNIVVNALIAYPTGEEFSKTKITSSKILGRTAISSALIPLNQSMFGFSRIKTTEKEIKKMVSALKNKMLKPIIKLEDWSQQGLVSLVKLCFDRDIQTICVRVNENDVAKVKSLLALCGSRIKIEVIGKVSLKLSVILLNLGVLRISADNVEDLADELVAKLKD